MQRFAGFLVVRHDQTLPSQNIAVLAESRCTPADAAIATAAIRLRSRNHTAGPLHG